MNLFYALNEGYNILKLNQKNSYKIDAELLLCESLNISREKLILNLNQKISILMFNNFLSKIKRRKENEPIAIFFADRLIYFCLSCQLSANCAWRMKFLFWQLKNIKKLMD